MIFDLQENVSLAELTTLKIGGAARFFLSAKSEREVVETLEFAWQNNLKIFILGGGSNVLISDKGFDGLVLQISLKGISVLKKKDEIVYIKAGAGEDWDNFCQFCVEENLQGIECLSGIPGLIGGTPVQNVGAYGQEVSETINSVRCFDREKKAIVELSNAECKFAYRASIFNTIEKNRYVVLGVNYALKHNGEPKILYRDLQNYFAGKKPDLKETRRAVLKIRAEKSMVINAADPNSKSAGSFFKNPIISIEKFDEVKKRAKESKIEIVPYFKVSDENVKIPAAWLIENGGFQKGFEFGPVGLSTKHTLAIINRGDATARDILALKENIQTAIKHKFDIELTPEPVFVGFWFDEIIFSRHNPN